MRISYDLHIHSCLSPCGDVDMTPNNIVNMACLLGLDAIAVSDHNSALNLPAVISAAKDCSLTVVPAMEVCTNEEVHILCYIDSIEKMLEFSNEIYSYLPNFSNKPEIFGEQTIFDCNDNISGFEDKLLINSIKIGIDKLLIIVERYGGVAVPAHIDKSSNSIISNLGFIPEEYNFKSVETKNKQFKTSFIGKTIHNSDAHYLGDINQPENFLEVEQNTPYCIIKALKGL